MACEFSNNELEFVIKSLKEGLRLDFRDESTYRRVGISVGPRYGHSEVKTGKTKVIVDITEEIVAPLSKRPQEGIIRFKVDIPSVPLPGLDESRALESSVLLSRLLNKIITQSRCVDLESLCIIPGERVIALNVSVSVMDQDGNVGDCACIGAIASLLSFRYPQMFVEGTAVKMYEEEEKPFVPLTLYSIPLLISFAILDDDTCIVDPTNIEELASDNYITFAVAQDRKVCQILKPGKEPISPEAIYRCSQIAVMRYFDICTILKKSLKNIADLDLPKMDVPA